MSEQSRDTIEVEVGRIRIDLFGRMISHLLNDIRLAQEAQPQYAELMHVRLSQSQCEYDDYVGYLEVYYERPETDEEFAARTKYREDRLHAGRAEINMAARAQLLQDMYAHDPARLSEELLRLIIEKETDDHLRRCVGL